MAGSIYRKGTRCNEFMNHGVGAILGATGTGREEVQERVETVREGGWAHVHTKSL